MLMQFSMRLYFVLIFLLYNSLLVFANDLDVVDLYVVDNRIVLFGYMLDTKYEVKKSSPPKESDTIIHTKLSPDNHNLIVIVGFNLSERIVWEIWKYNINQQQEPICISSNIEFGSNIRTKWHNNDVFEISWGGFGWKKTKFINITTNTNFLIDNYIFYDPVYDIYVALKPSTVKPSKIEVGPGFDKRNRNIELFDIKSKSDLNGLDIVIDVKINGDNLMVSQKNNNGILENIFKHDILKGDDRK